MAHQVSERKSRLLVDICKGMVEPLDRIVKLAGVLQAGPRLTAADQAAAGEDFLRACGDLLEQIEQTADPAERQALLPAARPRFMAGANPPG